MEHGEHVKAPRLFWMCICLFTCDNFSVAATSLVQKTNGCSCLGKCEIDLRRHGIGNELKRCDQAYEVVCRSLSVLETKWDEIWWSPVTNRWDGTGCLIRSDQIWQDLVMRCEEMWRDVKCDGIRCEVCEVKVTEKSSYAGPRPRIRCGGADLCAEAVGGPTSPTYFEELVFSSPRYFEESSLS